jgi:serine O-acetyltransferase
LVSHGPGLVIGESARIGADATILHQVTIGAPDTGRLEQMPEIGRDVYIGAGAVLVGAIKVGDSVIIGTNTVITEDIPDNYRVVSTAPLKATERRSDYRPIQKSS